MQVNVLTLAAVATVLALSPTVTHAARIAGDSPEAAAVEAVLDSAVQSSKGPVSLRSPTSPSKPLRGTSASDRPRTKPSAKKRGSTQSRAAEKIQSPSSPEADITLKGRKITVLSDDETGVAFFCRDLRRRLWVQERGWVVRVVRSCF